MWLEVAPWALAAAVGVTFVGGLVHGTLGFGLGLVSVPVLALVSPLLAPSPQVLLALPLAVWMAAREWRAADHRGALLLTVGGGAGVVAGGAILKAASQPVVDGLVGGAVLLAVGLMARGATVRRTGITLTLGGVVSGVMGVVSAVSGPPMALLYRDAPGPVLRATLAVVFGAGVCLSAGARAWAGVLDGGDVGRAGVMSLGLFGGLWVSRFLLHRVEGQPLRLAVLVFAGLSGGALVLRALA